MLFILKSKKSGNKKLQIVVLNVLVIFIFGFFQ